MKDKTSDILKAQEEARLRLTEVLASISRELTKPQTVRHIHEPEPKPQSVRIVVEGYDGRRYGEYHTYSGMAIELPVNQFRWDTQEVPTTARRYTAVQRMLLPVRIIVEW